MGGGRGGRVVPIPGNLPGLRFWSDPLDLGTQSALLKGPRIAGRNGGENAGRIRSFGEAPGAKPALPDRTDWVPCGIRISKSA